MYVTPLSCLDADSSAGEWYGIDQEGLSPSIREIQDLLALRVNGA